MTKQPICFTLQTHQVTTEVFPSEMGEAPIPWWVWLLAALGGLLLLALICYCLYKVGYRGQFVEQKFKLSCCLRCDQNHNKHWYEFGHTWYGLVWQLLCCLRLPYMARSCSLVVRTLASYSQGQGFESSRPGSTSGQFHKTFLGILYASIFYNIGLY